MSTLPTFTHLSDEERKTLFESMEPSRFDAGAVIITQGALQGTMYLVESGNVRVERPPNEGEGTGPVLIAELGPGEVFGEMSFLDRAPASATVTAISDVELRGIGRAEIDQVTTGDSGFPGRFYKCLALTLVDKLRATSRRIS